MGGLNVTSGTGMGDGSASLGTVGGLTVTTDWGRRSGFGNNGRVKTLFPVGER